MKILFILIILTFTLSSCEKERPPGIKGKVMMYEGTLKSKNLKPFFENKNAILKLNTDQGEIQVEIQPCKNACNKKSTMVMQVIKKGDYVKAKGLGNDKAITVFASNHYLLRAVPSIKKK